MCSNDRSTLGGTRDERWPLSPLPPLRLYESSPRSNSAWLSRCRTDWRLRRERALIREVPRRLRDLRLLTDTRVLPALRAPDWLLLAMLRWLALLEPEPRDFCDYSRW